ncbi:YqiJ family protein [Chitinispirillales bacterium ANBcel5]|uniref:YqiJ family protein n=1 Tax=Cellulosispirillum alkaliphilum TaxID=3039283 RepID=UPI002A558301|nr:YqiJ family protein [Chitinispirillales bacterium ANBcel5]
MYELYKNMYELLLVKDNFPFTLALTIVLFITVLEIVSLIFGIGLEAILDTIIPDIQIHSPEPTFLSWLGVGKVPILFVIMIFLTVFGLTGLLFQTIIYSIISFYIPWYFAAIFAFLVSLPVLKFLTSILEKNFLKDETFVVSEQSFIGKVATVIRGKARKGMPAEAKLQDKHGLTHYILLEPEESGKEFCQNEKVLIVSKEGAVFKVIKAPESVLN